MNYTTERESKRCQIKAKRNEELYKEYQLNLCGDFLEHALNFPFTARHVNQTDLLEPSSNHFSTACFSSIQHKVVQTFSISISCEVFVIFGMPTQNKNNSHIRSAGQNNSLAYKRAKAQQLPKTSTQQLTNTSTHKLSTPPNHQLISSQNHNSTSLSTYKPTNSKP